MSNSFNDRLTQLIEAEPQRIAALEAQEKLLEEAGRKDKLENEELQPKIVEKLRHVSGLWQACERDFLARVQELGFSVSISGSDGFGHYVLRMHFTRTLAGEAEPVLLSVTQRGNARLAPNGPMSFDFLPAEDSVFIDAIYNQAAAIFQSIRNDAITAERLKQNRE